MLFRRSRVANVFPELRMIIKSKPDHFSNAGKKGLALEFSHDRNLARLIEFDPTTVLCCVQGLLCRGEYPLRCGIGRCRGKHFGNDFAIHVVCEAFVRKQQLCEAAHRSKVIGVVSRRGPGCAGSEK